MIKKLKNQLYSLIRWSEKYTKTDMVYLTKGGFWATTSQIILSALSFFMAIAFANFISKEAYGQYKYILAIAGVISTFTLTGLGTAVAQSVAKGFEGTLNYAFWQNIKWSILVFLGSLGGAIYYFIYDNTTLGISLLIAGCFSPFLKSSNLYSSFLNAKKDFRRQAIYFDILGNLFPSLCLLIAMYLTNNPLWLVLVYFISNTLIGIILYLKILKIYKPNKKIDTASLSYSKHLSLMGILNGIASNIDQILVFHYIGAAQLAIYNFAIAIPNQTKGPLKSLNSLMFPNFVERKEKEIQKMIWHKSLTLFIAGIFIVAAYIILAPYVFKIFLPAYAESIFYSQIFAVSILSMAFGPVITYLAAKKKIKEQYISNVATASLQIIVTYLGIIYGGLLGLIIARMIVRLLSGLISTVLYRSSVK